jgi:hypothetical protein
MLGSQQAHVELLNELTGLTHDIFVGDVKDVVRRASITTRIFQDADQGEYKFSGQKTKFSTDLRYKTGAVATSGVTPDFVPMDAVQGEIQPTRRYVTYALDNLIELLATGEGSFEDISDRIFRHLWNAWENMEIRQSIGDSSGVVALVDARVSGTVVSLKDGYGHEGTNPLLHLSEGSMIGWYNISTDAIGGAGVISEINYADKEITIDGGDWEGGTQPSANDPIFFVPTANMSSDRFELERNRCPHGVGDIADPDANYTTVYGISEADHPRWKPFRKQSVTFDHLEVQEHWLQLAAKRGYAVSPQTDYAITQGAPAAQLARSLMAFQQQAYTGGQLQGGYSGKGGSGNEPDFMPHAGLTVGGVPIYVDSFFYHDVFLTLCQDKLYRIEVGGEADYWAGDGSMWQRIAGYDGKDGFVNHYMNNLATDRGAIGVLSDIETELSADDFAGDVPDY